MRGMIELLILAGVCDLLQKRWMRASRLPQSASMTESS
jgi:hypothetical protein